MEFNTDRNVIDTETLKLSFIDLFNTDFFEKFVKNTAVYTDPETLADYDRDIMLSFINSCSIDNISDYVFSLFERYRTVDNSEGFNEEFIKSYFISYLKFIQKMCHILGYELIYNEDQCCYLPIEVIDPYIKPAATETKVTIVNGEFIKREIEHASVNIAKNVEEEDIEVHFETFWTEIKKKLGWIETDG